MAAISNGLGFASSTASYDQQQLLTSGLADQCMNAFGSFGNSLPAASPTSRSWQLSAAFGAASALTPSAVSNQLANELCAVNNSLSFASSCWGDPRVNSSPLAGFQFTPTSYASSERLPAVVVSRKTLPAVVVSRKTLALQRLRQFTPVGVNEHLELATSLPTSSTQLATSLPTSSTQLAACLPTSSAQLATSQPAVPVFDFGVLEPTSSAQLTLEPTNDNSVTEPIKLMKSLVGKDEQSVLIVHNAIDGLSCAVLAIAGGFRGDVFSYPAESISEDLLKPYKRIYMADIGISESLFTKLNSSGKDVHIYDHHARNSFAGRYDGSVMDPRRSSTRIFYDEYGKGRFLFPETVNEFVDGIDVVARWQLNDPRFQKAVRFLHLFTGLSDSSKASCGVLYSNKEFNDLRDTEYVKTCVERLRHPLPHFFSEEDFAIINSENRKMDVCFEETMKTISYRTDELGRRFAVCRVHGNPSLILDRILKKASFISYVIGIGDAYRGMVRVSARARDVSVDLNQLEGFEGHPTAAGALYTPNKAKALLYNKKLFVGVKRDQKPYRWEDRPSLKERAKRGAPPRRLRQRAMQSQGMD